ncbi:MAG: translocation/assembly module TamB domain-containing protein [Saprospiraceae bacterium]
MQNKMLPRLNTYLGQQLGTKVDAKHVSIDFFTNLVLDDITIHDKQDLSILEAKKLTVDISLFSYFDSVIHIDNITIDGASFDIIENDGRYNYQSIIDNLIGNDNTSKKESSTNSWDFDLETMTITNSQFNISNTTSKINAEIPYLLIDIEDLAKDTDTYHINKIVLDDAKITIADSQNSTNSSSTSFPVFEYPILLGEVDISGSCIYYNNESFPIIDNGFDKNHMSFSELDLILNNVKLGSEIKGAISKFKTKEKSGFELKSAKTAFLISDTEVAIEYLEVVTNASRIGVSGNLKYNSFEEFVANPENAVMELSISPTKISKQDLRMILDESNLSDINIRHINNIVVGGQIKYNDNEFFADNLSIVLDDRLKLNGQIEITNIGDKNLNYNIDIKHFITETDEVKKILPTIIFPSAFDKLGIISGTITANGNNNHSNITNINVVTENGIEIEGNGMLSDFNSNKGISYDLVLKKLKGDPSKIVIDPSTLPKEVTRLGNISYQGKLKGNVHDISADGFLITQLGNADVDVVIGLSDNYQEANYNGKILFDNFDLGTFLQDERFGISSMNVQVNGNGMRPETLNLNVVSSAKTFVYNSYQYQNIGINGHYSSKGFKGSVKIFDPNIKIKFDGEAIIDASTARYVFNADVDTINLQKLGLTDSLYTFSGMISSNLEGVTFDDLLGKGTFSKLSMTTPKGSYSTREDIYVSAINRANNEKEYILKSPFAEAALSGNIKASILVEVLEKYLKNHIPIDARYSEIEGTSSMPTPNLDQNFNLKFKTKDINPIIALVIDDVKVKSIDFNIDFRELENFLDASGTVDSLYYGEYLVEKGNFFFDGKSDFINSNIIFTNISKYGDLLIPEANLFSELNASKADINLEIIDANDNPKLFLGGNLTRTDEYVFQFHDSLMMNNQLWKFSPYNQVFYGSDGLFLQDLKISKDNQAITLFSDVNDYGQAVEVLFDNFVISELSKIIDKENDFYEGSINGMVTANSLGDNTFITADIDVANIAIDGKKIGDLKLESIQDPQRNIVTTKAILNGDNNDVIVDLVYGINDQTIKGTADIERLGLQVLDPYLRDIIKNSSGGLKGKIDISGTVKDPILVGKLNLKNALTTPIFTNSQYRIDDEDIIITTNSMDFGQMDVTDVNGNKAVLSGNITHKNMRNMYLDLHLITDKFQFLSTRSIDNEIFYGDLGVKANITVKGYTDDILIDGTAKALRNSTLALSPLASNELSIKDDFIVFADPRNISNDSIDVVLGDNKFPFDLEVRISVDKNSEFQFVINPITGDKLVCRGNADLLLKMLPSGDIELYGTYTVSSGTYTFTYGVITKEFDINSGGKVIFNGDPLEGLLDIDAIYSTYVSTFDLLKKESNLSANQILDAQRKSDINVVLEIDGSILTPEISLDITALKNRSSSISEVLDSKLASLRADPDEMNNQIFGLLFFDSFILAENSNVNLASTGGDIAISSISGLIANQLNKLADNLIDGIKVNFDFNSYRNQYLDEGQGGVVTELGVGVSKDLFDDRLTIKVGTNFNLESSASSAAFNTIAGDFIIDYKLTEDGSYRVRAFSKSNYERLIDENSSKNGVSLSVRKEFGEIKRKIKSVN